eukprot:CAMPEP_0184520108 /NCGR_PEP_ID=MMETSP0198_2-20121128/6989_1 /TAXON_ID=1112570 /ORGANISM="Thraustochytrium sp., Strain LLF1b" /LENGTH=557 /DNA_ID=CAMNT_0026910679 /DNA_START=281 /DNA_END=1954 /DNA_ORIENTATION=+
MGDLDVVENPAADSLEPWAQLTARQISEFLRREGCKYATKFLTRNINGSVLGELTVGLLSSELGISPSHAAGVLEHVEHLKTVSILDSGLNVSRPRYRASTGDEYRPPAVSKPSRSSRPRAVLRKSASFHDIMPSDEGPFLKRKLTSPHVSPINPNSSQGASKDHYTSAPVLPLYIAGNTNATQSRSSSPAPMLTCRSSSFASMGGQSSSGDSSMNGSCYVSLERFCRANNIAFSRENIVKFPKLRISDLFEGWLELMKAKSTDERWHDCSALLSVCLDNLTEEGYHITEDLIEDLSREDFDHYMCKYGLTKKFFRNQLIRLLEEIRAAVEDEVDFCSKFSSLQYETPQESPHYWVDTKVNSFNEGTYLMSPDGHQCQSPYSSHGSQYLRELDPVQKSRASGTGPERMVPLDSHRENTSSRQNARRQYKGHADASEEKVSRSTSPVHRAKHYSMDTSALQSPQGPLAQPTLSSSENCERKTATSLQPTQKCLSLAERRRSCKGALRFKEVRCGQLPALEFKLQEVPSPVERKSPLPSFHRRKYKGETNPSPNPVEHS